MLKLITLASILALSSCMSTDAAIQDTDYACVRINLDGPTTDSSAYAQGIKVPDGVVLTPELLATICPVR